MMMKMNISCRGVDFIKGFEGCSLYAYRCPAGMWTIGFGHTATAVQGMVINMDDAERILRDDLKIYERAVNSYGLKLNQNQFDALVSFCYNVGPGNFNRSWLLHTIKDDPFSPDIPGCFSNWIRGGGKILPGLVRRRREESKLYFT